MKNKKRIVIGSGIIVLVILAIISFLLLNNKNKLTVEERTWINDNINTIQNINIVNNANLFGKNGSGVFYDFLNDFSLEYHMQINPITFTSNNVPAGISFGVKNEYTNDDIVFYADHYVLVSKNADLIKENSDLVNKRIGVNTINNSYVSKYLNGLTLTPYETDEALYNAIGTEVDYILVPLMQNLDTILTNNYEVIYHLSDIKTYYVMQMNNDILSNVLKKYYPKWESNLNEYFYDHELELFLEKLNISDAEIDKLQSVVHNYGFINRSPYEVIMGGKYGGIIAVYLSNFSDFADIEFNFVKYSNIEKLNNDIKNKKVELYFNYYNVSDATSSIKGPNIFYVIASLRENNNVVNSLNSLINQTVIVENNSRLHNYLKSFNNINIITYENIKEIKKIVKKMDKDNYYLMLDKNIYDYNKNGIFKNYSIRYSDYLNETYEFKVNDNETMYTLLKNYLKTIDMKKQEQIGLLNHYETTKTGNIMSKIAEYIIFLVVIIIILVLLIIRKSKKITIAKRIKKDDKMKFIDQLTSLKNRNYLSENISIWNNNTIYPQAIVVLDLNHLQEINDLYGYEEGDKQIQACANALIKTQLDNSEIMRTDGNEFVIYIVGYNEKQITNYMHKLNKEINKLPYDFGAEFGRSMIMDNIKTVEDAMNEAVEEVKKQKVSENEKEAKK